MNKQQVFWLKVAFAVVGVTIPALALLINLSNEHRLAGYFGVNVVQVQTVAIQVDESAVQMEMPPSSIIEAKFAPNAVYAARAGTLGRIARVFVREGELIAKGDPVAEIEVSDRRLELQKKMSEQKAAEAELHENRRNAERFARLAKLGAASEQSYEAFAAAVKKSTARVEGIAAEIDNLRQIIANSLVSAPTNGVVYSVFVRPGASVEIGATICEITESGNLARVLLAIGENERQYFYKEAKILLAPRTWARHGIDVSEPWLSGKVTKLFQESGFSAGVWLADVWLTDLDAAMLALREKQRSAGQVAEYETLNVLQSILFDGVKVRLTPAKTMILPEQAIIHDKDKQYVFIVGESSRVEKRQVRIGAYAVAYGNVDVLGGVKPGEKVVVVGQERLHDADRVEATAWKGNNSFRRE